LTEREQVKVDEELKRKRAELIGEVEDLTARLQVINGQVAAIDQVITIYDPAYASQGSAPTKPQRPKVSQQLPPEFARINKSEASLEALRDAGRPISTADCASAVAERYGLPGNGPAMSLFVTHVSAALNVLSKRNRVRRVGTVDGRKHLWEIAA